jgi:hypothetical protein
MQDVGEQQFLVLLLVLQAQHQQRLDARARCRIGLRDQLLDRRVDVGAVRGAPPPARAA